jgi:hypothetical protein
VNVVWPFIAFMRLGETMHVEEIFCHVCDSGFQSNRLVELRVLSTGLACPGCCHDNELHGTEGVGMQAIIYSVL